jgi:hypothetical protein
VVGGLSRLVRLVFVLSYGLFGLAYKLHGEGLGLRLGEESRCGGERRGCL